jgi:hypothetical protein
MTIAPRPKMNLRPAARQIAGDVTSKVGKPPSREGLRAVTIYVEPDLLKRAKKLVVDQDTSLQAVMSDLLTRYVAEHAKA